MMWHFVIVGAKYDGLDKCTRAVTESDSACAMTGNKNSLVTLLKCGISDIQKGFTQTN